MNFFCLISPIYRGKEEGGCLLARSGVLGCFHQKAPPSVGTSWKARVGLIAICTPLFTKYTPFTFFANYDTCFPSVMLRNFTDYAITPSLTSGILRNFTDCATMLPFDIRHVAELHGLPNDGC